METILVTGARSGIINKVIDNLLNKYYIYLTVHTESELLIVQRKYNNIKNIECFKLDVTNSKDREKVINLNIDIFISNAAIGESGSIIEMDICRIRNNFEVNVFSNFELTQIIIQNMIKKNFGKVIIISSLAGDLPIPFLGSYCATKASITKLAECLNMELNILKSNISISIIEPGLYYTGFNQLIMDNKYDDDNFIDFFNKQINMIRSTERFTLNILEKKKLDTVVNKIVRCVDANKPKLYYRTPLFQVLAVKLYLLFK